jgi:hypothetical protein
MVAKYKFKAEGADATLKELRFTLASSAAYALKVKIGTNEYSGELVGTEWKVANINYTVPAGTTAYADVYLTLAAVSSVTDGASAQVTLKYVRYSQAGTETENPSVNKDGAEVYVQKAVPEVTALTTGSVNDLNKGVLTTVTLYKWTIKAVGDDINATSNTTTLTFTKAGTSATTTIDNIKVYLNGTPVSSGVTVTATGTNETATSGTIVIVASGDVFEVAKDQTITIEVKADVTAQAGGWVRVWLAGDGSRGTTGNFVWYDGLMWVNGYSVKGLPAEGTDYYQHYASE